jgi:hypothetical protein
MNREISASKGASTVDYSGDGEALLALERISEVLGAQFPTPAQEALAADLATVRTALRSVAPAQQMGSEESAVREGSATPLRVWWIPQIPGQPFTVEVESVAEGAKFLIVLADYDRFQYERRIKPDYCNAGGLMVYEAGEWTDWCDEETGEDDPIKYVRDRESLTPSAPIRPTEEDE